MLMILLCRCWTLTKFIPPCTSVLMLFSFHGFLHLGNPRKPAKTRKLGNSETSQNDELWKPQKPQESETYRNWLTTAIVIIEIEVSFWVSGFPSFWKPMKTSENPEIFLPNC